MRGPTRGSGVAVALGRLTLFALCASDTVVVNAQAPPPFEIVSLQRGDYRCPAFSFDATPCPPPRTTWTMLPGGRMELENQLAIDLVRVAYGVERLGPKYVTGVPGWMWEERYDLIALTGEVGLNTATPSPIVDARARARLRSVIEERFKLRASVVKRKMDVLVLARVKGSFTAALEPSNECEPSTDLAASGIDFTSPPCDLEMQPNGFGARGMTMTALAQVLSTTTGMPVLDETGIEGPFDLAASWQGRREVNGTVTVKSVNQALKRFKLEVRKTSRQVDTLEIESVERPEEDR
jgi:uncharacterized protein (TIGR03435 family)